MNITCFSISKFYFYLSFLILQLFINNLLNRELVLKYFQFIYNNFKFYKLFFIENICIHLLDIFSIERTKNIFEKAIKYLKMLF